MTAKRTTNSVAAFATQQLQTTMTKERERENVCKRKREKKKSQTICESKQIMTLGCLHIELGGTLGCRREEGNGGKRELSGYMCVRLSICLSVR